MLYSSYAPRGYTASYTGKQRVTARNRPIQDTLIVPRTCPAIQLYSARVYSRAIQDTAYTLYSPILLPWDPYTQGCE